MDQYPTLLSLLSLWQPQKPHRKQTPEQQDKRYARWLRNRSISVPKWINPVVPYLFASANPAVSPDVWQTTKPRKQQTPEQRVKRGARWLRNHGTLSKRELINAAIAGRRLSHGQLYLAIRERRYSMD